MTTDLTGGLGEELEYVFERQPDNPDLRESVNAWIWDDKAQVGMPRIGVEAVADQWDTHDIQVNVAFADGRVYNIYGPGPIHPPLAADGRARVLGAGPLSFEMVTAFDHLRLRVSGEAMATSTTAQIGGALPGEGEPVPIEIEADLHPAVPPWVNGALFEDAKHVLDTQDEGDLIGHPWRFEQLCRASGVLQVGDERYEIRGGANRIRRQGIRRLARFRGHVWQACLFPSGRGFGCLVFPPRHDGKATYNEGYVFEGTGELIPARVVRAPWLQSLVPNGEDVSCVLETGEGTHTIEGRSALATFMVMPPEVGGGFRLCQAIARYSWDGEESVGMVERSVALDPADT